MSSPGASERAVRMAGKESPNNSSESFVLQFLFVVSRCLSPYGVAICYKYFVEITQKGKFWR